MADEEVLRLGIDPQPAAAGAREYKRATQDVQKSAQGAADANDQLAQATERMSVSQQAADQHMRRTRLTVDERIAAGKQLVVVEEAVKRATDAAAKAEQEYEQVMAHTKIGASLGAITPEQAAEEGRAAAAAYNAAVAQALQENSAIMQRTSAGKKAFTDLAGGLKDTAESGQKAALGLGALRESTQTLLRMALGTNPVVTTLTGNIGKLAMGATTTTLVLAGLAAIAYGYKKITEASREAREEQERQVAVLEEIARAEAARGAGELPDILAEQAERLEEARAELEKLQQRVVAGGYAGQGGMLSTGAADAARRQAQERVDAEQEKYDRLVEITEAGERRLREIREEGLSDSRYELDVAQRRLAAARDGKEAEEELAVQLAVMNAARTAAAGATAAEVVELMKNAEATARLDLATQRLTDAREEGTRRAEEEARARERAVETRERELAGYQDVIERAREYARTAREITEGYAREAYEAEAMLAVKQASKEAEDALTVALAMQAAVRANLGKVSDEQLVKIAEDARRTAQAAINTRDFTEAQERLARATREQTEAQEKQNQALKDYAASAALGVATGMLANGGDTGRVIGGIVGGAVAGGQAAGPWGALIGGAAAAVTSLFNMGKKAREAAEQFAAAQQEFQRSLDDASAMFDAQSGTQVEEELERIRQATNKWLTDLSQTWTGAKKLKPIDDEMPVDQWLEHIRLMALKLGEQIAMTEMAGKSTGKLTASHEALIDIYELTEKTLARQAELHQRAVDDFDVELGLRYLAATGREVEAEAMRLQIRQAAELAAALEAAMPQELIDYLRDVVHPAEAAAAAARNLAEATEDLAAAQEAAVRSAEDMLVRALDAMGRSEEAARAGLAFRQRREMADAPLEQQGALSLLHAIELLQLELNQRIAEIEEHTREQLARLDEQIDQASDQLQLTQQAINVHEQALAELQRVVEALDEFRDSLLLGPLTVLDPSERLSEAERQFREAYNKAKAGDADAAAELPGLAQAFLEASRDYFASGSGYQSDFQEVLHALETVGTEFEDRASVEEEILKELQKQSNKLERQIDELKRQQRAIEGAAEDEIRALQAEFDDRTNTLYKQLEKMIEMVLDLGEIADNTNLEQQLRNQIQMKEGVINALEGAYKDLNNYWTDVVDKKDAAFGKELNRLIGIINDLMGTGNNLAMQGVRVGAQGALQVQGEVALLRSDVQQLAEALRHTIQESGAHG